MIEGYNTIFHKKILASVNQLSAEIKLTEARKSTHVDSYPIQMEVFNPKRINTDRQVRSGTSKLWNDEARTTAAKISFSRDMAKLWNNAPTTITNATCLNGAKRNIKNYCQTLEL